MSLAIRALFGRPSRRVPWIITALLLLLGTGTAAYAFWASTTSSNNAAAAADALSAGSKPAVTANGASLSVSWAAGTTVNGRAATGYTVTRYAAATGGTGTPATGGCAGTVTTLTCTEQNVPGGIWYYTVTPTIALWTGSESPRSTGVSSDSTAPVASLSGISPTPNAAGWNSTSPVTVTITADDGTAGSGVASITYAVDGGAKQTVGGSVTSIPVSGDGTHTVSYFATDNAGNAGTAQSQTVRIDTQAPAAPGLSVPGFVNSANVAAVPVTGTAEAGAKITLTASDTGSGAPHSVTVTATASGTGSWSASLDLSTFKQGTVNYSAMAADAAGNTGAATAASNTKDTVAPAAPSALSVPAFVNIANASAVPVSGTAEAGGTVTVTAADAGSAHTVTGTATASGTGSWSMTMNLATLNDGTLTYAATVKDAAGNTSTAATATDIKDTQAPVLSISAPMYVNSVTAGGVTVSGTTEAGTAVSVTVRDSVLNGVTKAAAVSGSSWSATLDLSGLKDGALTYTASGTDAAGNSSTASASGTTSKETVPPTVTGITLANGGTPGTADAGDTVTIQYSEIMDATKFCSSWSNIGLQTLSANNDVTVTFNHTTTSNSMTVTSKTCTLNVGTISLGANANYATTTAPVVFVGANGSVSTVSWNPATSSLTVRLGDTKNNTGAQGSNVGTNVPSYTPASSLTDIAGNPFTTPITPFNNSPASRF